MYVLDIRIIQAYFWHNFKNSKADCKFSFSFYLLQVQDKNSELQDIVVKKKKKTLKNWCKLRILWKKKKSGLER